VTVHTCDLAPHQLSLRRAVPSGDNLLTPCGSIGASSIFCFPKEAYRILCRSIHRLLETWYGLQRRHSGANRICEFSLGQQMSHILYHMWHRSIQRGFFGTVRDIQRRRISGLFVLRSCILKMSGRIVGTSKSFWLAQIDRGSSMCASRISLLLRPIQDNKNLFRRFCTVLCALFFSCGNYSTKPRESVDV